MPEPVGPCAHCARVLTIYGRGLCRTCYRDPAIREHYRPLRASGGVSRGRVCRVCNLPWEGRSSWCPDCQRALPGKPILGARLREPLLSATIALYCARVEAGLDLWTGRPRH